MRRAIYILFFILATAYYAGAQVVCCPDFRLDNYTEPCADTAKHYNQGGPYEQENQCSLSACKHTKQFYRVVPDKPGYTYTWTITGGTPASAAGNPMYITWGNGTEGTIKVIIQNQDGSCRDTITKKVCLQDAPTAAFSFSPASPVCLNQDIQFTNNSTGANYYYWDFGDGGTSTLNNPSHAYHTAGTYTIMLVVKNGSASPSPGGAIQQEVTKDCGCYDTLRKTIVVKVEPGIDIIPGCKQMLCKGDTASYCTTKQCNGYQWSVTGGRILGSNSGSCINVVWDGTYPAKVTLLANCSGSCSNSAVIEVPVLYPTMPVTGNAIVCPGSMASYTLPAMPGTFYKWKLSGGGTIQGADSNTSVINVAWGGTPGSYTVSCNYYNPLTGCSGTASVEVKILPPYKIEGPKKFCVGNSFNFTANGSGNWTITPATGFTPSSFAAASAINGTWNVPGTYIISATPVMPPNYCSYPSALTVVVLDTPKIDPIKGPVLVCPNGIYIYAASSNMNAGFFSWTITGGTVLSNMGVHNDSVSVKWNAAGPYSISVKQTVEGCSSSPVMLAVDVFPPPHISGPNSACMDETAIYAAGGNLPDGSYTWSLSNALGTIISGQGTNTISIQWHGSTSIPNTVLTVTTCRGTDSKSININVPAPVNITPTGTLCSTAGITLSASVTNGTDYTWKHDNVITGLTTPAITIHNSGTYKLSFRDANGCTASASINIPKENLALQASLSTTDKTIWYCNETVHATLHAIPASATYCYKWFYKTSLNDPSAAVVGTGFDYTATITGYYWCEISLCNTSCVSITDTIRMIQYGCGGGNTPCESYTINITKNECNPKVFTLTTNPPAAAGGIQWFFGDGDEGYGSTVIHQYKDTGTFKVCALLGTAPYCLKDTCILVNIPFAANFSAVVNCDKATFANLSKLRSDFTASFAWSFPGGSPATSNQYTPPLITYSTSGWHQVELKMVVGNCVMIIKDSVKTTGGDGSIIVPPSICAKTEAPFQSPGNGGLTFHWNFGDGFTSNLQNTTHAYASAGNYSVSLTITDENGCSYTYTKSITVLPELTVSIGTDKYICPGSTVTLSATSTYQAYQWFKDGVEITGATSATYTTGSVGEYWVRVANGGGCVAMSNHIHVLYNASPVADIVADPVQCTGSGLSVRNVMSEAGVIYSWNAIGPAAVVFTPSNVYNPAVSVSTPGEYVFILTAKKGSCEKKDSLCISIVQSPTVSVTMPPGVLCEGQLHTFTATALPVISVGAYFYQWNTGATGNVLNTGKAGAYNVTVQDPMGCKATAFAGVIAKRPDVSLFPVGCDTLCWTDTLRFPLPQPSSSAYTINWYDDDGTGITNVGNGFILPLSNLQPGIHHLHATVSFAGGCADTTGVFDLYIKDCTLLPPCDNCTGLFSSATLETKNTENTSNAAVIDHELSITILKPVKEVRLSVADLQYVFKDSSCKDCKLQVLERGCLFAATPSQLLGTLLPDSTTAVTYNGAATNNCPKELVWKGGTSLPAGTYTIRFKITLPKQGKDKCIALLNKLCLHLSLVDDSCRVCEQRICISKPNNEDCKCNAGNNWTSLYLVPAKPGGPKPRDLILCNSTLSGFKTQTPYLLTGQYHCEGKCGSVTNEVTVYNQVNDIIYNRTSALLNETITFPAPGMYSVKLTANCGVQKCICSFKIYVTDTACADCTETPCAGCPTGTGGGGEPSDSFRIDSVIKTILPPDFNGEILVSKKDTTIYEVCRSFKDTVTFETAFDLASVSKTFTAMAVLKLMEEGKLQLDDAVTKYIPGFPVGEITIRMLLSHRSGLEDYIRFMDESGWDKRNIVTNQDILDYIIRNKNKVMIAVPGKTYDYSNTNYVLLSFVIEKASGQSYKDYLTNAFFRPLKMDHTFILGKENYAKATKSYYKNGKMYELRYLDLVYGDKNIYSTVRDLKKWDEALRKEGFFKKSTLDLAYTPQGNAKPFVSTYALGWKKIITANNNEILYHTGWWAGNRALIIRLLKEQVVIAVVSNNNFSNIADIRRLCDLFGDYQQSNNKISNF